MAKINTDVRTLKQTAQSLRQSATELELQKNTLNEVAGMVEAAWISQSTAAFAECVRKVGKNVNRAESAVRSSARSLEGTARKIELLELADMADKLF